MEKLRHKRSKIITHTDSRSTCSQHSFRPPPASTPLDKHQNRKCAKVCSDSSSSSSTTGADYKIFSSFGWKSSKRAPGTPIKKLLSEEMSRETETKRRSPNVIARLMGLDGLPVQQSFYKYQQKGLSASQPQKKSVEKSQKSDMLYKQKPSRSSSKDQQQFKDVFEVSEMPNTGSCRYSPHFIADFKLTESEMTSLEQKTVDMKCLSADEQSMDLDDVLQVPDSNKRHLQRYVQQSNSLFTEQLNDLQVATSHSHCYHKESVSAFDAYKYENIDTGRKSDRNKLRSNCQRTHQQCSDGLQKKFDRRFVVSRSKSSDFQSLGRDHSASIPTRIVVLKPNLGKVKNPIKTVSSPCKSQDILSDHKPTSFSVARPQKADQVNKNNLDLHISMRCSKEPRDIAREITMQMKNSVNGSAIIFSPSTFTGYVGDESSCDFSGNESVDEPEVGVTNLRVRATSRESSVNREARKRLSERWKMAHKSKEDPILSRGSTLAEMLAVPDMEVKTPKSDCMVRGENICDKFTMSDGSSSCVEPLGISSRDGWKDGCLQQLSRSKSLPASSTILATPAMNSCDEPLRNERYMITNDALKGGRIKILDLDRKDGLRRHPKYGYKKFHSRLPTQRVTYESFPDKCRNQPKVLSVSKESSQPNESLVSDGVDVSHRETSPAPENSADSECENGSVPFEHKKKLSQETSFDITGQGRLEHKEQSNLVQQELLLESSNECSMHSQPRVPGLESPSSCKEDQPSPVSVLEPSFADDMSSCSECFENLSADLQGLRMQLQLLKSESDAYAEGSLLVSCDEDGEASAGNSDGSGCCRVEDTWESSYIVDILAYVGFADNINLDKSIIEWHSPSDPVNPSIFDELEKKYSDVTTCPRSERRLLFDRVNAGLHDIHPQFIEPRPWLSSATKKCSKFRKKRGQSCLLLLLANLEKRENGDTLGKVLSREAEWLDLWNDMDVIGREVETVLIDELIAEVVVRDFV